MKQIDFYFDFVSPFAYLAFEHLPEALAGHSYQVHYKPVLFAALLQHHGQRGPAEIPGKRDWTYRHVMWLAQHLGIAMQMPDKHPFNPLPLLRLAVACSAAGEPNRFVTESIFRHVWRTGLDAADPAALLALAQQLMPRQDMQDAAVKAQLRRHTEAAVACGIFGVPTFAVDGKLFWGLDALPMLRDYLSGGAWFAGEAWEGAVDRPVGAERRR